MNAEGRRLAAARSQAAPWRKWGPYLSERQWGTVRALALWNGRDPILEERLYGLTNHEGNHGEDVKEYTSSQTEAPNLWAPPHAPPAAASHRRPRRKTPEAERRT